MNEKRDKIELIKAISNDEIDPKTLTSQPLIVSNGKESFAGLMISVAAKKAGKENSVVYVGEAKITIETILDGIKEKRNLKAGTE